MFKRKPHLNKILYYFILYTLITFVIGIVLKVVLVVHLFDQKSNISDQSDSLHQLKDIWTTTGNRPPALDHTAWSYITNLNQFESALDELSRQQKEQKTGLILQALIIVITLIIYSRSLWDMYKLSKREDHAYTKKSYRSFKIEYIVFLTLFIMIDTYALVLILRESPGISGWLIYTLFSLFIPTGMAIGSLYFIRKTKPAIKNQ